MGISIIVAIGILALIATKLFVAYITAKDEESKKRFK